MDFQTGMYVGLLVIFVVVLLIAQIIKISNDGKKDILEEMLNEGDISIEVYKKYKKKCENAI